MLKVDIKRTCILLLVAVVFMVFSLSGCGQAKEVADETATEEQENEVTETADPSQEAEAVNVQAPSDETKYEDQYYEDDYGGIGLPSLSREVLLFDIKASDGYEDTDPEMAELTRKSFENAVDEESEKVAEEVRNWYISECDGRSGANMLRMGNDFWLYYSDWGMRVGTFYIEPHLIDGAIKVKLFYYPSPGPVSPEEERRGAFGLWKIHCGKEADRFIVYSGFNGIVYYEDLNEDEGVTAEWKEDCKSYKDDLNNYWGSKEYEQFYLPCYPEEYLLIEEKGSVGYGPYDTLGMWFKDDFCRDEYDIVSDIENKYKDVFKNAEGPVVYRKGNEYWVYYDSGRDDLKVDEIVAVMQSEDTIIIEATFAKNKDKDYHYNWFLRKIEAPSGVKKVNAVIIEGNEKPNEISYDLENSELFIFN